MYPTTNSGGCVFPRPVRVGGGVYPDNIYKRPAREQG